MSKHWVNKSKKTLIFATKLDRLRAIYEGNSNSLFSCFAYFEYVTSLRNCGER